MTTRFILLLSLFGISLAQSAEKKAPEKVPVKAPELDCGADHFLHSIKKGKETQFYCLIKDDKGVFSIKDGPWKKVQSKVVVEEGFYKSNRKDGVWRKRALNGNLTSEVSFVEDEMRELKEFSPETGKPLLAQEYLNGKKEGSHREYDAEGNVSIEGRYSQDKKSGVWKTYKKGILTEEAAFREGEFHGLVRKYFANGQKQEEIAYEDGLKNGSMQTWNEQGVASTEGEHRKGKRQGRWVLRHPDGSRLSEGYYEDDKKDGPWRQFDPSGKVIKEEVFKNGVLQKTVR